MSGKSFSVWLNNEYLPNHPEYSWVKEVSSKSVKHSIECGCTAFTRFFKHQDVYKRQPLLNMALSVTAMDL